MSVLSPVLNGMTAIAAAAAIAIDHEFHVKLAHWSDRSIYRGPGNRRTIALTFDDGPSPQTPELLAYLRAEGILSTFFQLGVQAERYPLTAQQVSAEGHEIGNHAWSHTSLSPSLGPPRRFPSLRKIHSELTQTQALLTHLHGVTPRLFRPPFGHHWTGLDLAQRWLHLQGVQWTVIAHDWEWPAERVATYVLERIVPGAIICMHDGRNTDPAPDISATLGALKILVPLLREDGYQFETVSEMLAGQSGVRPVAYDCLETQKVPGERHPSPIATV